MVTKRKAWTTKPPVVAALAMTLMCAMPSIAPGGTFVVKNLNDSGPDSLRQAILDANKSRGPDVIQFATGVAGDIRLTKGELSITGDVSIVGPGSKVIAVRCVFTSKKHFPVFRVVTGVVANISGLTIRDGYNGCGFGSGILSTGTLTVTDCIISNNHGDGIENNSPGSLTVIGCTVEQNTGGISNGGTLVVRDSTIRNHPIWAGISNYAAATVSGCTINNNENLLGGGILNRGTMTVINSTLSGNKAWWTSGNNPPPVEEGDNGGGIRNEGMLRVFHSTITNNAAWSGGGIYSTGIVEMRNTILAGNVSLDPVNPSDDLCGTLTSSGYNLFGDPIVAGSVETDRVGVDVSFVLESELRDNRGPTLTHALVPLGPAVDAGDPSFAPPPDTDQRGFLRIYGLWIDIGAFELQPIP